VRRFFVKERRFFVKDPNGVMLNVVSHRGDAPSR
jgi:hypothetical protein